MFACYILDYTEQFIQNSFLTCSWRNLISNELEELQLKIGKKMLGFRNMPENFQNHSNFRNLKIINSFIYDEQDPTTDTGKFSIIANVGLISLIGLCSMSYVPQFSFLNSPKLFYVTGMTIFI